MKFTQLAEASTDSAHIDVVPEGKWERTGLVNVNRNIDRGTDPGTPTSPKVNRIILEKQGD